MEGVQLSLFEDVEVREFTQDLLSKEEKSSQLNVSSSVGMDIFTKFEAVKVEKSSLIAEEDRQFCEGIQKRFDEAVSLILRAKQFYQENQVSNLFLSTKNLIKDLDEKLESKVNSFIYKIVEHFRSTYSVTIDKEKFRKYDHTVTYQEIVDEILAQMNGMNFTEKAHEEIRSSVRETIYNPSKVKVQSAKVSIADYLYFEEWFGKYQNRRWEKLDKLLRGIELFESGSPVVSEPLASININSFREDWFNEFSFPHMNKFQALKCYKNGKVDLKFKSYELAMEFAREFLNYS